MEPFETGSMFERVAAVMVGAVYAFIPISALVRIVAAFFSKRVRRSIAEHKLVHVVWLIGALGIAFIWLMPFIFTAKTKGS